MAEKEKLDIYSWILSPEIRKAWKKNPPLPLLEQAAIIGPAYRPVEEKLWVISILYESAKTAEEKEKLSLAKDFYAEAIRQMKGEDRENDPGAVWQAICSDYDMAEDHYPVRMDFYESPHLFYSYEEAWNWAAQYVTCGWESCLLTKWALKKDGPKEELTCSARRVNGVFCTTHAYMDGFPHFDLNTAHLPYSLPFATGDLVKLEGPVFSRPIFGVWAAEQDGNGTWYNWMGYKEYGEYGQKPLLTAMSMGYHRLNACELSVLDWLRPASEEELPKRQKSLAGIAKTISRTRKIRGEKAAFEHFREAFPVDPPKRRKKRRKK